MLDDCAVDDRIVGGYYGPGYREIPSARNPRRVKEYIATFKHALLFLPKIVIADHMVVNTPNFRIAYHNNSEFRILFLPDLVEIAHFERYGNGGPHFTLIELREFYSRGRFHGRMPLQFQTGEFDNELQELQSHVSRPVNDSTERDPRFTALALEHLDKETLEPLLGKLYGAYDAAFRRLHRDQPVLGIIHFDPERTWPGDRNIFDYMADAPNLRGRKKEIARKFGPKIGRAHRAMVVKAELDLIGRIQPILPPELSEYRTLVCKSADLDLIDPAESEHLSEPLDLHAIGIRSLWALSHNEIVEIRQSDEARAYFEAVENAHTGNVSFTMLVDILRRYTRYLNMYFQDHAAAPADVRSKLQSRIDVLQGKVLSRAGVEIGVTTVVQIIGIYCFKWFNFIPASALAYIGKMASDLLSQFVSVESGPVNSSKNVNARAEYHRVGDVRESLTQYE